ncbi:MAG: protein kinase, partial [Planctomycetes bacterium]|nr:protein kinase [Planctomycetota bacterium]
MKSPTQFGPYPVRGLLGEGGAGAVYLAWHPTLQCEVAIKTLVGGSAASEVGRRRFQREIRALAQLSHPGLLPILGSGEQDGVPWFVMRRIAGGSLEDHLRDRGPLSFEATLELGLQLCSALSVAHERGILHRDLKPDNVLCDEGGRYVLTDFGLAKDLLQDASIRLSQTGAVQGTPGYWAPEQAKGEASAATRVTDVYGLGAVLYAALTGGPPIQGESLVEVIVSTLEVAPAPPSSSGDSLPALDALVLRCLAKSPADRFQSLAEASSELGRLQSLGREELVRQAARQARARGVLRGALVGVSLLVFLGVGAGVWQQSRQSLVGSSPSPMPTAVALGGPALFEAAEAAFGKGRPAEGVSLLRRAAEAGHARAMHSLGRRLASGRDVRLDSREAVRWYRRG